MSKIKVKVLQAEERWNITPENDQYLTDEELHRLTLEDGDEVPGE